MDAYKELQKELEAGEVVSAVVFGPWVAGLGEEGPPPIPPDKQGVILSIKKAKPFMRGWSFNGEGRDTGSYTTYIWTNRRILWVVGFYYGGTELISVPRYPCTAMLTMPTVGG